MTQTRRSFLGTLAGLSVTALVPFESEPAIKDVARPALNKAVAEIAAHWGPFELVLQTSKGELRFPLPVPMPASDGRIEFPRFEFYAQSPMIIHSGEVIGPQFSCPIDFGYSSGTLLGTGDRLDVTGDIGLS